MNSESWELSMSWPRTKVAHYCGCFSGYKVPDLISFSSYEWLALWLSQACRLQPGFEEVETHCNQVSTNRRSKSSVESLHGSFRRVALLRSSRASCARILLCDLAGSERLKKSDVLAPCSGEVLVFGRVRRQVSGDAQKEAIEINKRLPDTAPLSSTELW